MQRDTLVYILATLIISVPSLTKVNEGFSGNVIHMYETAPKWQNALIPSADKSQFDASTELLFFQ